MTPDVVNRLTARSPLVRRSTLDRLLADYEDLHTHLLELQHHHDDLHTRFTDLNHHHGDLQRRHDELQNRHHDVNQRFEDVGGGDPDTEPFLRFAKPGHFYSPIPRLSDALEHVNAAFRDRPSDLPGIDLRLDAQLTLAARLTALQEDFDAPSTPAASHRYYTENPSYGRGDALILESMLRELRPRQIIEIGSGHSSALMLDTIDRYLDDDVSITFIEPFADVLREQFRRGDADRCEVVEQPLQSVDVSMFDELEPGDLLFIDSTHVVRPGSDVLREILEILPRLRPGVVVHLHDIFYPFEYPPFWVKEGRVWGEAYLLRAFLVHNSQFEIMLWPNYVEFAAREAFREVWPKMVGEGFGAIWLRRVE